MAQRFPLATVLAGLLAAALTACSAADDVAARTTAAVKSVPPDPAEGEGCAGIHGNPPMNDDASLQGTLADLYPIEQFCPLRGELLQWTDPAGTARNACLHSPAQAAADNPLPLVVFLGGSLAPGGPQTIYNNFEADIGSADLTGDPDRPGFNLLLVDGRDKAHHYPYPDDTAWGFDHWHRNFDRDDEALNVDAATIDHFIAEVRDRGLVDPRRIYFTGWSNGSAMGILYTLNTPGIAAAAVYSSPDPYSDILDPCAQQPFGDNLRPIMTVHNHCDIAGICQTGHERFAERLAERMPDLTYRGVLIDLQGNEVEQCDAACAYSGSPEELLTIGSLRHLIWPYAWTPEFFAFLRENPLPE